MYNRFKWANIKPEYISYNEFNDVLRTVRNKNYRRVKFSFGSRKLSVIRTYSILQNESKDEIRVCYGYNDFHRYIVKHIYEVDELKEQSGISGMEAYDHVNRRHIRIVAKGGRLKYMTSIISDNWTEIKEVPPEMDVIVKYLISNRANLALTDE